MSVNFVEDGFELTGIPLRIRLAMRDASQGEISQRIAGQFIFLVDSSGLSSEDKESCKIALGVITAKLATMCHLRDSYAAIEDRLIAKASKEPAQPGAFVDVFGWDELYREFDLFSVQVKSVLDHITFFLRYVNGRKAVGFSGKGVAIMNSLSEKQMGKRSSVIAKRTAERIIQTIQCNMSWLTATIDVRDDFNHYLKQGRGTVTPKRFVVLAVDKPEGIQVVRPMNDGALVRDITILLFDNMMMFVEAFIGLCFCPSVTRFAIVYERAAPGRAGFSFIPWAEVDKEVAAGANPDAVLNERNPDPSTWVTSFVSELRPETLRPTG